MCKHRFRVQLLQNPLLCSSTRLQRVRVLWCGQDHSDRYAVYDGDLPDCPGTEPTSKQLLRGNWLLLRYKLLRVNVLICRMNKCL
jgi:hypothetical protein